MSSDFKKKIVKITVDNTVAFIKKKKLQFLDVKRAGKPFYDTLLFNTWGKVVGPTLIMKFLYYCILTFLIPWGDFGPMCDFG